MGVPRMGDRTVGSVPPENLFTPTFGVRPYRTVGRGRLMARFGRAYAVEGFDRYQSSILLGSRGSGKTVMLAELREIAASNGYLPLSVAAGTSGFLDSVHRQTHKVRIAVGDDDMSVVSETTRRDVHLGPLSLGKSRTRTAQMHGTEDIRDSLCALADNVDANGGRGVLLTVDEMHLANVDEMVAFANAYQLASRDDGRNVLFVGGALPEAKRRYLNDDRLSFFRRCANEELPPLDRVDAIAFLTTTIDDAGGSIDDDALETLVAASGPLPFRMQIVGDAAWRIADAPFRRITVEHASRAVTEADLLCDDHIYEPMWNSYGRTHQQYLAGLAELGGSASTRDLASVLHKAPSRLRTTFERLVQDGCITAAESDDGRSYIARFGPAMSFRYADLRLRSMRRHADDAGDPFAPESDALSSATQRAVQTPRCGKWMPRSKAYCARPVNHAGGCRSRI